MALENHIGIPVVYRRKNDGPGYRGRSLAHRSAHCDVAGTDIDGTGKVLHWDVVDTHIDDQAGASGIESCGHDLVGRVVVKGSRAQHPETVG